MSKLTGTEVTSYAGAATSIGASLTLTDIGVIVGIVTALLTFGLNAYFAYQRNKREQIETEARLRALGGQQ
jgi:hypothetical protein